MEGEPSGAPPPPLLPSEFPPLPSSTKPRSPPPTPLPINPLTSPSHQPQATENPAQISPEKSSLWSELFTRASTARNTFPPPSRSADGTPIVRAPPSILLKSTETWKDHIVCYFFGVPPSHRKIFSDLNPIWGKRGDIQIRRHSARACLIFIPHTQTREWVLNVGFWSAGTVAFSTTLWSPTSSLSHRVLSSAPVWLSLHDVPPPLWSADGFKLIASGIGEPLPAPGSPSPTSSGTPRVRAVVSLLNGPLPTSVIVEDDAGNQVKIGISYPNFPPLCPSCSAYGHRAHRCPLGPQPSRSSDPQTHPDPPLVAACSPASPPATTMNAPPAAQEVSGSPVPIQRLLPQEPSLSPSSPQPPILAHSPGPSPLSLTSPTHGPIPLRAQPGPTTLRGPPGSVIPPPPSAAKPPEPCLSSARSTAPVPSRPKSSPAESPPSRIPLIALAASSSYPPKPTMSHLDLLRQLDPSSASPDPTPTPFPGGLASSPPSGPSPIPPPPQLSQPNLPSVASFGPTPSLKISAAHAPHPLTLRRSNSSPASAALLRGHDEPAPVAASLTSSDKSQDESTSAADSTQSPSSPSPISKPSTARPSDLQSDHHLSREVSPIKEQKK